MKIDERVSYDQFTYKIKQSLFQVESNSYSIEYFDPMGVHLITLITKIPERAEPIWIESKVNELYTRFTT